MTTEPNNAGKPKIIVVCGPTATGKSDLAVDLALFIKNTLHKEAEIISADSRQIYTHLNIGTGKITKDEMRGVRHHMLDILEPSETYSAADYKRDAERIIAGIHMQKNIPIICGGTGQYIDAVIFNQSFPEVEPDEELRNELETKTIEEVTAIFNELNKDKDGNAQLHSVDMQNKRRIIRAIEILKELGHIPPITKDERFDVLWIGLDTDDETLKNRINRRLDSRLQAGMIEESQRLLEASKLTMERMQKLGLEYAHIADLLASWADKSLTHADTEAQDLVNFKEALKTDIWHYAKRQRTWFRRNPDIHWLMTGDVNPMAIDDVREKASGFVKEFLT